MIKQRTTKKTTNQRQPNNITYKKTRTNKDKNKPTKETHTKNIKK